MLGDLRSVAGLCCAGVVFLSLLSVVRRRRAPLTLALPLAAAAMVVQEAVLLNLLSLGRAIGPLALAGLNLGIAGLLFAWARAESKQSPSAFLSGELRALAWALRPRGVLWLLVPLGGVLALVAIVYPPTNWDSMTYHMARVAHWIQLRSVAYYPTGIARQNLMGPGAEYVILLLQSIGGTDRWANCVQLACWLLVVISLGPVLRIAGLPAQFARLGQVFVATLPMAVLQATSTQNDLAAALMTIAVVVATIPFFRGAWRSADANLLVVSLCAAFLVKATALLVAAPFVLVAAWRFMVGVARGERSWRKLLIAVASGAAIVTVVLGPDFARKFVETGSLLGARPEIFGEADPWKLRLFNSVAALCSNAPWSEQVTSLVARLGKAVLGQAPPLYRDKVFSYHEDFAGNPVQTAVTLVAIPLALFWTARRGARRRALILIPFLGWISFHFVVRNQAWLTRLQLPIFVLAPLLWVPFAAKRLRPLGHVFLVVVTATALVYGAQAALHNATRPVTLALVKGVDRAAAYYASRPWDSQTHDNVLTKMREVSCNRLGLVLGEDSYDYPLTWRGMQRRLSVRHYREPSTWPCLVFSDGPPPAPPPGHQLRALGRGMFELR